MSEFALREGWNLDPVALTGEVIYESVQGDVNKKVLKRFIHRAIQRRLFEVSDNLIWASYLVLFSPGQEADETRCQVDIETDGERAAFSIGYGQRPHHAFGDAVERLQWYEKNQPVRVIV